MCTSEGLPCFVGKQIGTFRFQAKRKCTRGQALRLCTSRTAHRGSRGIALLFLDHITRRGEGVSVTPRPLFTPGKDPVPIVQEAGWAPGPVWTGAENLVPTGIRSPDHPARGQSLYWLRYPAHISVIHLVYFTLFVQSSYSHLLHWTCRWLIAFPQLLLLLLLLLLLFIAIEFSLCGSSPYTCNK